MTLAPFERTPPWQRALKVGAVVVSLGLHLGLGAGGNYYAALHAVKEKADTWVEMVVVVPPEPPPPPPPPEPEPEEPEPKPKPKPKKVEFEETVKEPPPPEAKPERRRVRRVQGLSRSSFGEGGATGIDARAGTDLGVAATDETLTLDEAAESVAFAAVTVAPKCKTPAITLSDEDLTTIKAEEIEGSVRILFDVHADGAVRNVRVSKGLHPVADSACVKGWTGHRCKPGKQGDEAVTVTGMSYGCRYKATN